MPMTPASHAQSSCCPRSKLPVSQPAQHDSNTAPPTTQSPVQRCNPRASRFRVGAQDLCTVGAGMESSHDGWAGAIGRRETGRERMWVGEGKTGGLSPMCSSIYCTEGQDGPCLVPSTCPPLPLRSTNGLLIPCGASTPVVSLLIDNLLERDPTVLPTTYHHRCDINFSIAR